MSQALEATIDTKGRIILHENVEVEKNRRANPGLFMIESVISPRSGRTKIAQRLSAGIKSLGQWQPAKRATDCQLVGRSPRGFLPPVSRARPIFFRRSQH